MAAGVGARRRRARCASTGCARGPAGVDPAGAAGASCGTPIPPALGTGPVAKVLSGCVMDVAFRPTQRATHAGAWPTPGYRAVAHAGAAACCGALAMHYGQPEAARAMARARIAELEGAEMVVVNAVRLQRARQDATASCWPTTRRGPSGRSGSPARTRDLIELAPAAARRRPGRGGRARRLPPPPRPGHRAARDAVRGAGADCVELGDGGRCCGAAGLYSVLQPELAGRLRRAEGRGRSPRPAPPVVAVANPGLRHPDRRGAARDRLAGAGRPSGGAALPRTTARARRLEPGGGAQAERPRDGAARRRGGRGRESPARRAATPRRAIASPANQTVSSRS